MVGEIAWEYAQGFQDLMGRLTFLIHDMQHKEWFLRGSLPLTRIPLMQQKIGTTREALEHYMRIESMEGYTGNTKVVATGEAPELSQV